MSLSRLTFGKSARNLLKMADEPVSRILFGALLCSSAPRRSFL